MTREEAEQLSKQLSAIIQAVAGDLGVKVRPGRLTWGRDGTFKFSIEGGVIGEGGDAPTREATEFKTWAHAYGLRADHLGATFENNLRKYKIVGLSSRSRKHPILCESLEDGRIYKFSERAVGLALNYPPPRALAPQDVDKVVTDVVRTLNTLGVEE